MSGNASFSANAEESLRFFQEAELLSRSGHWIYDPDDRREYASPGLIALLADHGELTLGPQEKSFSLFTRFSELPGLLDTLQPGETEPREVHWSLPLEPTRTARSFRFRFHKQVDEGKILVRAVVSQTDFERRDTFPVLPSAGPGEQMKRHAAFFEGMSVFAIDRNERVAFMSKHIRKVLGLQAPVVGAPVHDYYAGDSEFVRIMRSTFQGRLNKALCSFQERFFEVRMAPLHDDEGRIHGVIGFAVDMTDREIAFRAMRTNEEKYRTIFECSRDAVCVLDKEGRITLHNHQMQQLLQASPEEIEGRRLLDFSPSMQPGGASSAEKLEQCFRRLAGGETQEFQWAYRRRDGHLAHVDLLLSPLEVKDSPFYIIHLAYDRSAEIEAKRTEFLLTDVFASLQDGIFLMDRSFNVVRTNKAMETLYPEQVPLSGKKCYHKDGGTDVCLHCPAVEVAKINKPLSVVTHEPADRFHPERWIEHACHPIIDQRHGQIVYFFNSVRDITERIHTEKELENYRKNLESLVQDRAEQLAMSESRLESLLEACNTGILFVNLSDRITYANSSFAEMLGYSREEIVGRTSDDLICIEFPEAVEERQMRRELVQNTIPPYRAETAMRHREGYPVWVEANVSAVKDSHGVPQQLVVVLSDISEKRKAIHELMRSITEAEGAKADADAANVAKSEFLAHMSHEIRTPLNGVIGLCDLLLKTDLVGKQLEYARLIKASGKSLLFLINDILDLSKIEAGKLDIDSTDFQLHEMVESVLGIFGTRAGNKGLELCGSFAADVPREVFGDAERLRQVLINLIGNAIKFTDEGGILVRLGTVPEAEALDEISEPCRFPRHESGEEYETKYIRFEVVDTGIGIPKDRMDRLFQSFTQVDATTSRKYGGTGLGLSISARLVDLMSGKMGVESTEGKGTTFWFLVPLGCQSQQAAFVLPPDRLADRRNAYASSGTGTAAEATGKKQKIDFVHGTLHLEGERVLIVDDNPVQRQSLREQLECWGIETLMCTGMKEALRLLRHSAGENRPFRMVVADSGLEDGSGYALAETIQSDVELHETPVILLLPLAGESETSHLAETVITLTKPVYSSALFDATVTALFTRPGGSGFHRLRIRQEEAMKEPKSDSSVVYLDLDQQRKNRDRRDRVHILVAEDNRVNQIVVKDTLETAGYHCDLVDNGILACEAVAAKNYDVVLMDCQMPEMDGYEATRVLRAREAESSFIGRLRKRVPIIALTANATKEDEAKCLEAGMDAYCCKPINPKNLIEMIDRWAFLSATPADDAPVEEEPEPTLRHQQAPKKPVEPLKSPPNSFEQHPDASESGILFCPIEDDYTRGARRTVPKPSAEPVRLDVIAEQCGNDANVVQAILDEFLRQTPRDLLEIKRSLSIGDLSRTWTLCHSLKGTAGVLGAAELHAACDDMELACRKKDLTGVLHHFTVLEAAAKRCSDFIHDNR